MKKILSKILGWVKMLVFGAILFLIFVPSPATSQIEVEVNIENQIGPEFDPSDHFKMLTCTPLFTSSNVFPLDFALDSLDQVSYDDSLCPSLTIFNNSYQACFIVDIFEKIEPAIIIGLYSYAIFNL